MGFSYYFNDNNGVIPPGFGYPGAEMGGWYDWWPVYLTGEYGRGSNYIENRYGEEENGNIYRCPESSVYGIANGFSYAMPAGLGSIYCAHRSRSVETNLEQPSETGLLLCSWIQVPVTDYWLQPPHPWAGSVSNASNRRTLYHSEGRTDNFLFVDTHVENLADGEELNGSYVMYYGFDGEPAEAE